MGLVVGALVSSRDLKDPLPALCSPLMLIMVVVQLLTGGRGRRNQVIWRLPLAESHGISSACGERPSPLHAQACIYNCGCWYHNWGGPIRCAEKISKPGLISTQQSQSGGWLHSLQHGVGAEGLPPSDGQAGPLTGA